MHRICSARSGAAAIRSRDYRYLSPVFDHAKGTNVVMRILRAALTNNPALHLKAVASCQADSQLSAGLSETEARVCRLLNITPEAFHQQRMRHARQRS